MKLMERWDSAKSVVVVVSLKKEGYDGLFYSFFPALRVISFFL